MAMGSVIEFLFILFLPFLVVGGVLGLLFGLGGLLYMASYPEETRRRLQAWFRRRPRTPRQVRSSHYYKAYWTDRFRSV
jgi:hypothetical protein